MKKWTLASLMAITLLLSGCRNAERIAEERFNALLPEVVGPADKYSSRIRGSLGDLSRGRMNSIHAEGVNVRLSENMVVDHLQLDLKKVHVDTKAKQLRGVESILFTATMGDEKLNRYLRIRRPDIPGLAIELSADRATVHAKPEVYGITAIPVTVDGTVNPGDGGLVLNFVPNSARVSIVPVPGPVLRYLVDQLNPVLDLSTMRIPVHVTQARIDRGALVLSGDVAPADLMRVAGARSTAK